MKYIIVENGEIYSVSDEFAKHIEAATELANSIDGDMSAVVDKIRKYGKYIGTAIMTIRD